MLKDSVHQTEAVEQLLNEFLNALYEERMKKNKPIDLGHLKTISLAIDFLEFERVVKLAFKQFLDKNNLRYSDRMGKILKQFFENIQSEIF